MSIMSNKTIRYDDEFKAHAVKMVIEQNKTPTEVASDLGVSQPTIRRWVEQASEPEDSKARRIAELEAENKKLKKQLENTKETVDVLKKSVAIFIKP